LLLAAVTAPVASIAIHRRERVNVAAKERPITTVINQLQTLLDTSRTQLKEGEETHAKAVCLCDETLETAQAAIDEATDAISVSTAAVAQIQGERNELSQKVERTEKDIDEKNSSLVSARSLNQQSNAEFEAKRDDLTTALTQLSAAIEILTGVGADQSVASAADHTTIVGASLLGLSVVSDSKERQKLAELVQRLQSNPGTHSAQSGAIVGILSQMEESFRKELQESTSGVNRTTAGFQQLESTLIDAINKLELELQEANQQLETSGNYLQAQTEALDDAKVRLSENQQLLSDSRDSCTSAKAAWTARQAELLAEQSALTRVITLLSSDKAFNAFGKVEATSTQFLQLSSRTADSSIHTLTEKILRQGRELSSVQKVVTMLQAGDPFKVILAEIERIISSLDAEAAADVKQRDWCVSAKASNSEQTTATQDRISQLNFDVSGTEERIEGYKTTITQLKGEITTTKRLIAEMLAARQSETEAYHRNLAEAREVEDLLNQALTILRAESKHAGSQSSLAEAISLLSDLEHKTQEERATLEADDKSAAEHHAQQLGESRSVLETDENELPTAEISLSGEEKSLVQLKKELGLESNQLADLHAELSDLTPGCEFIEKNMETRKANRKTEKEALQGAQQLLTQTTVYRDTVAAA